MKALTTKREEATPTIASKRKGVNLTPPPNGLSFINAKPVQKKENNTGLPDQLKSGVESLSGIDMSDVKVHYNSSQPAQLNAHAYAQGNQIHIAPGQETHLPHEAWHVVQQKQGRVKPTKQLKGKVNLNDEKGLEKEADVMGSKAIQSAGFVSNSLLKTRSKNMGASVQRFVAVKNPQRLYENLPVLVALVRNAILAVSHEHADEPFFLRVINDVKFFEQIVEELFSSDPTYNTMKEFTDEIIKTGLVKSDLNPEKFTKEEWALLHRMESHSFKRFVEAKEGAFDGKQAGYEAKHSKYNPRSFGDKQKHTWDGNLGWLQYVVQHFSKLILTDVPLTVANLFRQMQSTRPDSVKNAGDKDFYSFSAYAREIAFLLKQGYVPVSSNTIGITGFPVISMVKIGLLPPTVQTAIRRKVKVDVNEADWIIEGDTGFGNKNMRHKLRILITLNFFRNAGFPVNGKSTIEDDPVYHEKQKRAEEQETIRETRKESQRQKGESYAKQDPEDSIINRELFINLIREIYQAFANPKKQFVNKVAITQVSNRAFDSGFTSAKMSRTKIQEFIKDNKNEIWPH